MIDVTIRNEIESDRRRVEEITRDAFWNLYVPGCNEHYLAHVLRDHPDFIGDLDLVALAGGELVGNIMFTVSHVVNEENETMETATFGPVSVLPPYQGKGVGSALIREGIRRAREMGFKAILIYGSPGNYCKHGFRSSRDFGVAARDGKYPYGLLALELEKDAFKGRSWKFGESAAFDVDPTEAEAFDATFEPREKGWRPSQEEFSIACRAFLE